MYPEEHLRVLRTNIAAVQSLVQTVAGTLGPKGLDILLVDEAGRMILTNDGIEILRQSDFQHPAARLAVDALQAQEQQVGDGTTTATVLTGALLGAALRSIEQGVPVNLLIKGIQRGIEQAITTLQTQALPADPEKLFQVALIAAREDQPLATLVWQAAQHLSPERIMGINLADWITSQVGATHHLIPGVVVGKRPLNPPLENWTATGTVLVLADGLEPEALDSQTLSTEAGFSRYLKAQDQFQQALHTLIEANVCCVITEKAIAPIAEAFLYEHNILALARVIQRDRDRVCRFSGARPAKALRILGATTDLLPYLGQATVHYQWDTAQVMFQEGGGEPQATVVLGAVSAEVAAEQERIGADACGALQAALKTGVVTGGGVAEWTCRSAVQDLANKTEDLSRYGILCVVEALGKPLEQIILNSGYAPLEKLTQLEAQHRQTSNPHLGIDCETGCIVDLAAQGIFDPAGVKTQALSVAGEITLRILRIQTLIRRRPEPAV